MAQNDLMAQLINFIKFEEARLGFTSNKRDDLNILIMMVYRESWWHSQVNISCVME